MSLQNIRTALEAHLLAISSGLDTVIENGPAYTPTVDVPYQAAYLLRATPDNQIQGSSMFQELGILQVNLYYPMGAGPGAADARAQSIRDQFKRGTSLTDGGITIVISATPDVSRGRQDGNHWMVPVNIRWQAFVNS